MQVHYFPEFQQHHGDWIRFISEHCGQLRSASNTIVQVTRHPLFAPIRDTVLSISGLRLNGVRGIILPEGHRVPMHIHSAPVYIYFLHDHPSPLVYDLPQEFVASEAGKLVFIPALRPHAVAPVAEGDGPRFTVAVILEPPAVPR